LLDTKVSRKKKDDPKKDKEDPHMEGKKIAISQFVDQLFLHLNDRFNVEFPRCEEKIIEALKLPENFNINQFQSHSSSSDSNSNMNELLSEQEEKELLNEILALQSKVKIASNTNRLLRTECKFDLPHQNII
jgi:hypothetical protein